MQINDSIDFNTDRPYTVYGQKITATIKDVKVCDIFNERTLLVEMVDHSRDLKYLYELDALTQSEVMRAYDNNRTLSQKRIDTFWAKPRTHDTEHPDIIIDVKIPKDWEDTSWHNDMCPSFETPRGADNGFVRIYIDHLDGDMREIEDNPRFSICTLDENHDHLETIETNSWLEVLTTVKQLEW